MRLVAARGLVLAMLAVGCKQVLGIDDASLDPQLAGAGPGTASGAAHEAGNGGLFGAEADSGSGGAGAGAGAGHSVNEPAAGGAGGAVGVNDAGGAGGAGGDDAAAAGAKNDGMAGAAGQATVPPTLCETYCDTVTENCRASLAVYTSREMCLAVCAHLPSGAPGDRSLQVNSVHCRLEAAVAAGVSEPEYSCPIAAPGGNGKCGSNCQSLCALRANLCSEWLAGDQASCLDACAKLDDLGGYTTDPAAEPVHTRGGHVQCRLYHVSAAAIDEPETHCLHADGASPCVDR